LREQSGANYRYNKLPGGQSGRGGGSQSSGMITRAYLAILLMMASWYSLETWVGIITIQPLEVFLGIAAVVVWFMRPCRYSSAIPLLALGMAFMMICSLAITRYSIPYAMVDVAKLLMGIVAIILIRRTLQDAESFKWGWRWLSRGVIISATFGMLAYPAALVGISTPFVLSTGLYARIRGLIGSPNRFGALTGIIAATTLGVLLSSKKRNFRSMLICLMMVFAVFMSGARGATLSLIAGVPLGAIILRVFAGVKLVVSRKAIAYLIIAAIVFTCVGAAFPKILRPVLRRFHGFFSSDIAVTRFENTLEGNIRWFKIRDSIPHIKQNPWLGVGPGNWGSATAGNPITSAHNTYLEYLTENGILGVGFFLAVVFGLYIQTIRAARQMRSHPDLELRGLGVGLVMGMTCHLFNMNTIDFSFLSYVWLFFGFLSAYSNVARYEMEKASYYWPTESWAYAQAVPALPQMASSQARW